MPFNTHVFPFVFGYNTFKLLFTNYLIVKIFIQNPNICMAIAQVVWSSSDLFYSLPPSLKL